MITLTILGAIAIILTICAMLTIGVGSLAFIFMFGDILVCACIIAIVIKLFAKK